MICWPGNLVLHVFATIISLAFFTFLLISQVSIPLFAHLQKIYMNNSPALESLPGALDCPGQSLP